MKRTFVAIFFSLIFAGIPSSLLFAQDEDPNAGTNAGRYGSDSLTCMMNISLYREFFKQRIAIYSVYFPPTQNIFFYTLKEGDTYRVECWINEDTRIRASKQ